MVGEKGVIEKEFLLLSITEVLERKRGVCDWHCFVQFSYGGLYHPHFMDSLNA